MSRAAFAVLAVLSPAAAFAASPAGAFSSPTQMPDFGNSLQITRKPASVTQPPPAGYDVAPMPNQDSLAPTARASGDASFAPGLFTRSNQYRGAGISPDSSAQIAEERRVKPGAGIKLNVPLD